MEEMEEERSRSRRSSMRRGMRSRSGHRGFRV
jgi:hypothetical protein